MEFANSKKDLFDEIVHYVVSIGYVFFIGVIMYLTSNIPGEAVKNYLTVDSYVFLAIFLCVLASIGNGIVTSKIKEKNIYYIVGSYITIVYEIYIGSNCLIGSIPYSMFWPYVIVSVPLFMLIFFLIIRIVGSFMN